MERLSDIQRAAVTRLQGQFGAAVNTHGPLRCVLIHKEGEDFRLPRHPPFHEDMPGLANSRGSLYSYRLYCQGPNGEEVLCKTTTAGAGGNSSLDLDKPVSRLEPFSGRDIYLLRKPKEYPSFFPLDPKDLSADPKWQELSRLTGESQDVFWRLAGDAGRCFGADDCAVLPEVARESLEASDDSYRWLWIVFDLAWNKIKGSSLQAQRWVWHEADGEGTHSYAWEPNTDRHWADTWKEASRPRPGPDEAERIQKIAYLKAWAERRPGFYYSSLDDLFLASVWAIDLLTLHTADSTASPQADTRGQPDKPDEKGFVAAPSDPIAYRPASKIVADFAANAPTMKDLNRILAAHSEIRRWKPSRQRLFVNLGDWQAYVDARSDTSNDGWSDHPAAIEARTAQIRKHKGQK